jgi:SAM-dependent methyltransferase
MATSPPDTERASSFGSAAVAYDTFRPGPPAELARRLGPVAGSTAVDVAAGTGLVTRFLAGLGARVAAVEPDTRMAAVLAARSSGVSVVAGSAEALPVDSSSVDLVTVSSAWHWFDHDRAAAEFARVLRPGGRLAVFWNSLDYGRVEWMRELRQEVAGGRATDPSRRVVDLPDDLFGEPSTEVLRWTWERTPEQVVGLLGTYSGTIVTDPATRDRVTSAVRVAAEERAEGGVLVLPMACRTVVALRT